MDRTTIEKLVHAWAMQFMSHPATHRSVAFSGVNFQRLREGRVVEHWTIADVASLLNQLNASAAR